MCVAALLRPPWALAYVNQPLGNYICGQLEGLGRAGSVVPYGLLRQRQPADAVRGASAQSSRGRTATKQGSNRTLEDDGAVLCMGEGVWASPRPRSDRSGPSARAQPAQGTTSTATPRAHVVSHMWGPNPRPYAYETHDLPTELKRLRCVFERNCEPPLRSTSAPRHPPN